MRSAECGEGAYATNRTSTPTSIHLSSPGSAPPQPSFDVRPCLCLRRLEPRGCACVGDRPHQKVEDAGRVLAGPSKARSEPHL